MLRKCLKNIPAFDNKNIILEFIIVDILKLLFKLY